MSPVHTWLGASPVQLHCSKLEADGTSCLLSLATTNFLFPLAFIPCSCMVHRTRSWPTQMPRATSSSTSWASRASLLMRVFAQLKSSGASISNRLTQAVTSRYVRPTYPPASCVPVNAAWLKCPHSPSTSNQCASNWWAEPPDTLLSSTTPIA